MNFICTIYIIAILNCLHSHFFLQYLHLLKLLEASDSYQWYDCLSLQWLSLISLFRKKVLLYDLHAHTWNSVNNHLIYFVHKFYQKIWWLFDLDSDLEHQVDFP